MALLTAGAVVLAATGGLVFTGSGDWLGTVSDRAQWGALGHPAAYFAGFLLLVWGASRALATWRRAASGGAVAALVLMAFALHVSTARLRPAGVVESVMALAPPRTNVFYDNARRIVSPDEFLRGYGRWAAASPVMATRTHPPGPEMLYATLRGLFQHRAALRKIVLVAWIFAGHSRHDLDAPATRSAFERVGVSVREAEVAACVALALNGLACLVVVPVYLLGAEFCSRRAGLLAAAFAALLPAVHCFSPGLDQVYPCLAAWLAWLACVAARRRSLAAAFGFGALLCGSLLFSMAFVVIAGLVVVVALAAACRDDSGRAATAAMGGASLAAVLGFAAVVVAFAAAWRLHLFAVWLRCLRANATFNAASGRPYGESLVSNPAEYAVFLGVPLAGLFLVAVWRSVRTLRTAWFPAVAVLCLAGCMAVLNVAGVNRGEVARLWMFTMPLCAVAGAAWLSERPGRRGLAVLLLALQFAQVACFRVCIDAFRLYAGS